MVEYTNLITTENKSNLRLERSSPMIGKPTANLTDLRYLSAQKCFSGPFC